MGTPNWAEYLKNNEDANIYIKDARLAGIDTGTQFQSKYGKSTTGWENDWLNLANQTYGTQNKDASQFNREQLAKLHYDQWGKSESRNTSGLGYYADSIYQNMSPEDKAVIDKQQFQNQYGGMGEATKKDFDTLLGKLEGSKIRQEEAKNVSARPGIYAAGLANIMKNF
jgi:hypothetical protein